MNNLQQSSNMIQQLSYEKSVICRVSDQSLANSLFYGLKQGKMKFLEGADFSTRSQMNQADNWDLSGHILCVELKAGCITENKAQLHITKFTKMDDESRVLGKKVWSQKFCTCNNEILSLFKAQIERSSAFDKARELANRPEKACNS